MHRFAVHLPFADAALRGLFRRDAVGSRREPPVAEAPPPVVTPSASVLGLLLALEALRQEPDALSR